MSLVSANKTIDSKIISFLRFPLAILVVMVHSNYRYDKIADWSYELFFQSPIRSNLVSILTDLFSIQLGGLAVPTFFFISGFLFYKGLENWNFGLWGQKMYKRIFSLLIPFLIWNTLFLLWNQEWPINVSMYWCSQIEETTKDALDLFNHSACVTYPYLVPLWFIRDLMVVLIFTPILHYLLLDRKHKTGLMFIVLLGIVASLGISTTIPGLKISSFFYFCLGSYFSINRLSFSFVCKKVGLPIAICFVLLTALTLINKILSLQIKYIGTSRIICGIVTLCYIAQGLVRSTNRYTNVFVSYVEKLSPYTFFIYVGHLFMFRYANKILLKPLKIIAGYPKMIDILTVEFIDAHPIGYVCLYFAEIINAVGLCVLLYFVLHKYIPNFMKIICGR